jgi:peptide-methionine (S)-S-oxide reductase
MEARILADGFVQPDASGGQGPDEGRRRSTVIFYGNDEQNSIADAYIARLEEAHVVNRPIVTTVIAPVFI